MKPPKMPPHLTLSFIADDEAATFGLPSLCDSTLLRVQSPNPVEILSKKSPEKLLLPQPTDLDLETLRSNDDAEGVTSLLELSSSCTTTMPPFLDNVDPKHFSFGFTTEPVAAAPAAGVVDVVIAATGAAIEAILSSFLVLWDLEER